MHSNVSSSILTTSRSIYSVSSSMHTKQFVLYLDPLALRLICMSDGVVKAKIQQLGQQAKFKEVLRLKKLPPIVQQQQQPEPEEAAAQASTSAEAEAERATATLE